MQRWRRRVLAGWCVLGLTVTLVWAQTAVSPAKTKLERLKIAVAPLGFDSNLSWSHTISGLLDKRPALEFLVGIDRYTGTYIPELAEKWEMAPDGQTWTVTLRKGVKFHEHWGEFTARDVRHAVFLITQPDAAASGTTFWRGVMGVTKTDTVEDVIRKTTQHVEIVDDYTVVFHLQQVVPEFVENISSIQDLPMESKARWDAGGKDLYGQKVVGTGPFEFVERKLGSHVLYKRVENHWRKTPEYRELEFRWVPEGVTRLASLLAGEVHISDVDRALHKDAMAKGMKISVSKFPAMQHQWQFGGTYFATPRQARSQESLSQTRGAAGDEPGRESAGPGANVLWRPGATASGHGVPSAAEHGRLARHLESRLGHALRGALWLRSCQGQSPPGPGRVPAGFCVYPVPLHPARTPGDGRYRAGHGPGFPGHRAAAEARRNGISPGPRTVSQPGDPRRPVPHAPCRASPGDGAQCP